MYDKQYSVHICPYCLSLYKILYCLYAHSQNCEKRLLDSSCLSVCPSVRSSVSTSAWKESVPTGRIFIKFDLSIFRKSAKKIKASLTSDKNNGYPTSVLIYNYDSIKLNSSKNEKRFRQNL